jgi:GNAT superfamily N-acetyltransferase
MAKDRARVRLATEADLPRLIELLSQLELDASRETPGTPVLTSYQEAFDEVTADPKQQLFVIEVGGRAVGSACLLIVPNLSHRGRPYAVAENVVVDAELRSSGYGEVLMRHLLAVARSAGCYKLSLTSNKQRKDAHRFYERLGFRATHEGFRVEFD